MRPVFSPELEGWCETFSWAPQLLYFACRGVLGCSYSLQEVLAPAAKDMTVAQSWQDWWARRASFRQESEHTLLLKARIRALGRSAPQPSASRLMYSACKTPPTLGAVMDPWVVAIVLCQCAYLGRRGGLLARVLLREVVAGHVEVDRVAGRDVPVHLPQRRSATLLLRQQRQAKVPAGSGGELPAAWASCRCRRAWRPPRGACCRPGRHSGAGTA